MHFSAKKLFLIGFFILLLVGIPVSIYLLQQQQELRSRAEKATNISFTPGSSVAAPISKNIGDDITLNVSVDPGTNLVSYMKLEIQYDPDKIATASSNAFQANNAVFPTVQGPIYSPGKIVVTLSVGPDPTKAIQNTATAATVNFKAIGGTGGDTPTLITFSSNTQVLSVGSTDESSENVLAGSTPATIIIAGGTQATDTPTPTSSEPVPTVETNTPTPTTEVPPATPTPASTTGNVAPACTALTADVTTGTAPLAVNFTANGTDSDGTITKATFNFGDGQVSDVTTGGGIGSNSANVQLSHSYTTAGTFQATAILTDDGNGVSDTTSCAQTITVTGAGAAATATPTLAATGSTSAIIGFGAIATLLIIGGALLFFAL